MKYWAAQPLRQFLEKWGGGWEGGGRGAQSVRAPGSGTYARQYYRILGQSRRHITMDAPCMQIKKGRSGGGGVIKTNY